MPGQVLTEEQLGGRKTTQNTGIVEVPLPIPELLLREVVQLEK